MSTKHVAVREYLRGLLADGLAPGDRIPSERELCDRFGVSRMTVRQAVDALVVEGVLERVQGRGTFVGQAKVDMQLRLTSFDDEMRRRGMEPASRVLRAATVAAPPEVAQALELPLGAHVSYLHRVRLADAVPMALEENWCPEDLVPGLLRDGPPPSGVYTALVAAGYPPSWGEDTIEAVAVGPREAELLGIRPGAPAMRISRRTFSADVPVDFSRAVYRGDRYALWSPVSPPRPALVPPRPTGARRAATPTVGVR